VTDEELRAHFARLGQGQADIVAELRELRQLLVHPSAQERAERLFRAMSEHVGPDEPFFDTDIVFAAARDDFELSSALAALGLENSGQLGYWLRSRSGRAFAGLSVERNGRGWKMSACR